MKFKFIGKKDLRINTLTNNQNYSILNIETINKYIVIYVIDNNKSLLRIPYSSIHTFNDNWRYVHD